MDSPRRKSPGPDARRPQSLREVQPAGTPPTEHTSLLHHSTDTTSRIQETGGAPPDHCRNFLDSVGKYLASLPCSPCLRGEEQTTFTPDASNPSTPAVVLEESGVRPSPALRSLDRGESSTIDQGAALSAGDSGLPYEQSYRFNLKIAKKGVEAFKNLHDAIEGRKWEHPMKEQALEEIQALYLGIKPYINLAYDDEEVYFPLELIKKHTVDDIEVLDTGHVFSKSKVKEILEKHKEYFPDYDGEPIESYLSRRGSPYVPNDAEEIPIAQSGLLFGYPPNDVKKYARYNSSYQRVLSAAGWAEYKDRNKLAGQFLREGHRDENFLNQHQQEIRKLIDEYTPERGGVIEGTKEYVIGLRKVSLPGFVYFTDDPQSDENRAFAQRVQDAFEQSGMNDFIRDRVVGPPRRT